jgi:glyoxylate reductase
MPKYKIFVTRKIPQVGLDLLKKQKNFEVKVSPYDRVLKRKELLKFVRNCDAILAQLTDKIDEKVLLAAGPQLKIVANYAVGYDNLDLAAFKKLKIKASNTPGVLTEAVAEHTFALIMALTKRVVEADKFTRAGKYQSWAPMLFLCPQLEGKILGVIGLGRIGYSVAQKAVFGLGMKVVYNDIKRDKNFEKQFKAKFLALTQLLKTADIVSLHVPLLPSTRHLISSKQLKLMKKTAYLINTSRGPVIDEKALWPALKTKQIAGAGIDVFECEPKIACARQDEKLVKSLDNLVITPHIASATFEARQAMAELAAKNIIAVLNHKKAPSLIKNY